MKNARLLRHIGQIDEDLILEAEFVRFQRRRWAPLVNFAACLALVALVAAVPLLLPTRQEEGHGSLGEQYLAETEQATEAEIGYAAQEFQFGGLTSDMTQDEVRALLGEPEQISEEKNPRWFYPSLTVQFHFFDQRVCRIWILKGSTLTLPNGIGIGSSEEQLKEVYPDLPVMQEYHKAPYLEDAYPDAIEDYAENTEDTQYQIHANDLSLHIGVSKGSIEYFSLYRHKDPMLEALTTSTITIYTPVDAGRSWERVTVIDKAAKGICTVLTISEAEEPWSEKTGPFYWMDFGNGTAVELYGNDHAAIYTYSGEALDLSRTDGLVWKLSGCFPSLDDYVAHALALPTEPWESE